jgi:anti-sigma factor RsiW
MNSPWSPEALDLLLSCYLDDELDMGTRLELETWLQGSPEGRAHLDRLRDVATSLADLRARNTVPAGWTVKAYQVGIPAGQSSLRRLLYVGLGQAMARPRVSGQGARIRKVRRRWRTRLKT